MVKKTAKKQLIEVLTEGGIDPIVSGETVEWWTDKGTYSATFDSAEKPIGGFIDESAYWRAHDFKEYGQLITPGGPFSAWLGRTGFKSEISTWMYSGDSAHMAFWHRALDLGIHLFGEPKDGDYRIDKKKI